MKLTIYNFRKFTKETIIFLERGKLILLKGSSGIGKTTILESIRWCFHGSMKNLYPFGTTQRLYVKIEIEPDITIYRQKSPEKLTISYTDSNNKFHEYEDLVAQNIIDSLYGNKEVWSCCSYVSQKMRCKLLTVSQTEKIEILNKISFNGEDPRHYIEQINNKSKFSINEYKIKQKIFQENCSKLQEDINNLSPNMDFFLNDEQFASLQQEIESLQKEIQKMTEELIQQSEAEGKYKSLKERQNNLKIYLDNNSSYNSEQLISFQNDLEKLKIIQEHQNEINKLKPKLILGFDDISSLEKELNNLEFLSMDDYNKAIQEEAIRNKEYQKTVRFNLSYDLKTLQNTLKTYSDYLEKQKNLKILHQERNNILSHYQEKLTEYNIRKKKLYDEKLQEYQKHVTEINQSYQEKLQEYLKLKQQHENEQNKLLNDYNKRKEEFIINQKKVLEDYSNRKQTCIRFNKKQEEDYNKRKQEHLDNYQNNLKLYLKHKQIFEDEQNELLENYNKRKEELLNKYNQKLSDYENLSDILNQKKKLPIANSQDIYDKIEEIRKLEASKDLLQCPECQKPLRLNSENELEQVGNVNENIFQINIETKLKELDQELTNLKEAQQNAEDIKKLELKLIEEKPVSQEKFLFVLGKEPKIINYDEVRLKPVYEEFTEKEPNYMKFNEEEPIIKEYDIEEKPVITEYSSLHPIPEKPIVKEFDESQISYEKCPELELPEHLNNLEQLLSSSDFDNLEKYVEELKRIKYYSEVIPSSNQININIQRRNNLEHDIEILNKINQHENVVKTETVKLNCTKKLSDLERIIEDYKLKLRNIVEWKKEIELIENDLKQFTFDLTLNQRLKQKKELYSEKVNQKEQSSIARKIKFEQDRLNSSRQELLTLNDEIMSIQTLREIASNLETNFLESTIESINHALQEILQSIFDDPINIKISLYKEIKSKKKLKINFNLNINYKGTVYDSISQLSGGEGDRISLALIIALNRLNNSPFILLDECISSLDGELKERCINMIQQSIPNNKTVLCVSHNSVEGYYDSIIDVQRLI